MLFEGGLEIAAVVFEPGELLLQLGDGVLQAGGLREGFVPLADGLEELVRELGGGELPLLFPGGGRVGAGGGARGEMRAPPSEGGEDGLQDTPTGGAASVVAGRHRRRGTLLLSWERAAPVVGDNLLDDLLGGRRLVGSVGVRRRRWRRRRGFCLVFLLILPLRNLRAPSTEIKPGKEMRFNMLSTEVTIVILTLLRRGGRARGRGAAAAAMGGRMKPRISKLW